MRTIIAWTLALGLASIAFAQDVKPAPASTPVKKAEKKSPAPKKAETLPAPAAPAPEKPAVKCKRMLEIYGFIKLDAAADTGLTTGNDARYAKSGVHDNQFNMTAKETRLGLNFLKEGEVRQVSGKIEFDFYGTGGEENKGLPMMRHAYLEIARPERNASLLAGQTSDVIAPLNPLTVNYTVYWWAGNIGYRRPQLRCTKTCGSGDTKLTTQVALSRTIGDAGTTSGENSGFPTLQGRLALSAGASSGQPLSFGVWGHFGQEQVDLYGRFVTSSMGGDMTLEFTRKVEIKSEAWWGRNMDAFLGGIGQGMNAKNTKAGEPRCKEIHAKGGWVALTIGPFGKLKLYGGAGFDDPEDLDLNKGDRARNTDGWAGLMVSAASDTRVGLEYSYFDTQYLDAPGGFSHRGQVSFIYDF